MADDEWTAEIFGNKIRVKGAVIAPTRGWSASLQEGRAKSNQLMLELEGGSQEAVGGIRP